MYRILEKSAIIAVGILTADYAVAQSDGRGGPGAAISFAIFVSIVGLSIFTVARIGQEALFGQRSVISTIFMSVGGTILAYELLLFFRVITSH